jgi:TonB-linked SusC/RagA family outer membrane protein
MNHFILSKRKYAFMLLLVLISGIKTIAQTSTIKGKVTDEQMQPLPGVTVLVKGTTTGTSTDNNGEYSLAVADRNGTLVVSYIGYISKEVAISNQTTINVSLVPDIQSLSEVVVVGYGEQTKKSITSAVSSVASKELSQSPAPNVSNMITGRIAGITAIQDRGSPGNDQSRIYVRGIATTGNIDPLFMIDGVPRTATDFNRLAPTEVESISVLKDAAAAAVYGARGANGVILVTTKRGAAGRTSFSYSLNYGLQKATRLPDYVDAFGYADLYNKALENEGRSPLYTPEQLQKFKDGSDPILYPNTDWMSIAEGTSPMQQHNLSVSGGTEKAQYFISFNYLNQKSLFNKENNQLGFQRYNFRSNIDVKATNTTRVAFDVSGYLSTRTEPGAGYGFVFENINRPAPVYAAKYPNGLYGPGYSARNGWAAITESGYQRYGNNALLSRLEINQELPFINGLSVKGIAAFDYKPNTQKNWSLPQKIYNAVKDGDDIRYDQVGGFANPSLYHFQSNEKNILLEAHTMYNRSFGKHAVNGLLLYSQQENIYEDLSASRNDFLSNQLDIINSGGTGNQRTSGNASLYRRQSIVGRASYAYNARYLLEFSFRYDGSTLFAQGKRFGFFPALSAGWVLSEERFLKNNTFLNYLKIRGSYGELGNDQIGQYQYLTFYGYGSGVPMGEASTYQSNIFLNRLANTDVTWETSKKANIGLEATIMRDFTLEADYFWERRDGILGQRGATIPATLGTPNTILPFENFQKVNNEGYEIVLGYSKQLGSNLSIQTRFSLTHARNKVMDIGEPADRPERIRQAGRPLYSRYGYKALGLFQSQAEIEAAYGSNHANLKPGDIRYADLNNDQKIDGNDITYIGSTNLPINIYGLNTTLNFKGFEFSMFWQAGTGNQMYFGNWMAKPFNQAGNALERHRDYWSPENPGAAFPRILTSSAWNYDNVSDFWLYDMNYLRLKNLQLAYSLPMNLVTRIKAQNIQLYVNGTNLLTFSPYKEVDPENTNGNGHFYPQQVIYNFGTQITF